MFKREMIHIGGSSSIYKYYNSVTQKTFAVKVYNSIADASIALNEIKNLQLMIHPGIISLEGFEVSSGIWKIYLEKCEMDLLDYVQNLGAIPIRNLREKVLTLFQAVAYLHFKGFVHSDIKPENIGITFDQKFKLLDFGSCLDISNVSHNFQSSFTFQYASPQRLYGNGDPFQNDIWSLGVTLFVAATGSLPFMGDGEEYIYNVLFNEPSFELINQIEDSRKLLYLLKGMLRKNPEQRFTISECLLHSFFE